MSSASGNTDPWFMAMVGQWWTPPTDVSVVGAAAIKRRTTATAWQHFSDHLRQELSGSLNPELQKGMAAESIRDAFTWGADQAGEVAKTNGVISDAHHSAHESVHDLNSRLETIAHDGKSEINQIQQSKDLPPIKVGKIVEVVMRCQEDANAAAAPHTQNVFEAMQTILDQRGIHTSARQFAQQHGIDTTRMLGSPSKETVTQQVQGLLGEGGGPQGGPAPSESPQAFGGAGSQELPPPPPPAAPPQPLGGAGSQELPTSIRPAAAGVGGIPGSGASIGQPGMNAPLPMNSLPTTAPANAFGQSALSGAQPPNAFMQGLDHGLNQGAPTSAALNNVPPVSGPVQPQVPVQPPVSDVPASTAPVTAPAVDAPSATAAPSVSHSAVTDSGTTYLAGPAAAASTPAAPIGSLPTYGSDIRPPMPTISAPTLPSSPAVSPSISSAASPASAPVSPSAGAGGIAQPVVRQPTAAPLAHPAPAGIGEQAVVATAGGAAAGAASAQATAKARLQRLVDHVANQEPRLRWAAGEQADGTTLLVTDLASGWIPPGIALPSVVTLLEPGERRGDIETLLGQVSASASYSPVHYLPESAADDAEPIPTSPRPRQVPAVDELGWELGQATNWRDGLPQMAHTLAKAASTGTGVIDNEVEFLQQHLAALRDRVLDAYPDDVDGAAIANWQLLASIEALAASDSIGANYHFAWFQALNYVP